MESGTFPFYNLYIDFRCFKLPLFVWKERIQDVFSFTQAYQFLTLPHRVLPFMPYLPLPIDS